ncbi:hypothetical protein, partial [Endozoicomonas sp. ALC013]|uniref:hypothetical protein n=1 Tax=Endozoicomonas sp. ALC013 TaxID=3403076 RepID=UPI003BB6101A
LITAYCLLLWFSLQYAPFMIGLNPIMDWLMDDEKGTFLAQICLNSSGLQSYVLCVWPVNPENQLPETTIGNPIPW